MRATAEPIEGNLVRLSVEIEEPEVNRALDDMVKTLSKQIRVPGFRPGKVPRRVLEARMGGANALRAEALREALPDFYAQAITETEVDPIAPPEIDITAGEESGPVVFDATVQVRPSVAIGGYEGLQITVPGLEVTEEDISRQIDRLRENDAELVEVDRPAVDGDFVTIDVHGDDADGTEVAATEDYLYEVGSGTVTPELDEELRGAKAGDILAFTSTPPESVEIAFRVLVKDVKRKDLPEATDAWAAESSEFETVAELRDDITDRVSKVKVLQAQMALRQNSLDALVELVNDDEIPEVLVEEEVQQRVQDLSHRLGDQNISIDQFLAATGKSGDDLVAEIRAEAHKAVKADLGLRALAEANELVVTDQELDDEIVSMAERMDQDPVNLRAQLDHAGRTAAVRSEQRKMKAMTWLQDNVHLVDENGNEVSRDDLQLNEDAEETAQVTAGSDEGNEVSDVDESTDAESGQSGEETEENNS